MTSARRPSRTLLALLSTLALLLTLLPASLAPAAADDGAPDIVISQVYGGGGNSGAPLTHDYVELFNRGDAPASLDGLSIQYASAAGTGNLGANSGQLTELPSVILQPGQYYLVQQAGGSTGDPLPTPDLIDLTPIAMAAGAGKVALVEGQSTLGCNGGSTLCDQVQLGRIVDLIGYGSANFFEGSGAAPTLSNTTAAFRAAGGCEDTDDNAADFAVGAPAPRNSATPLSPCQGEPDDGGAPLVISQVYGGGGNSGATLTNDFIELFNRSGAAVDVSGWSVQYASAGGTSWQVTALGSDVLIPPGGYLLVQQAAGTGGTVELDADVEGSIAMSATNGKVALVASTAALTGSCPLDGSIDFVGFGGSATCFEGEGPTPALSNTTAAFRAAGGCQDTDDNTVDFTTAAPAPRNSSTPVAPCGQTQPVNAPVVASCTDLSVIAGEGGSVTLSATDEDGIVTTAAITDGSAAGIALVDAQPATEVGGALTVDLAVIASMPFGDEVVEVSFVNDDEQPQTASCTIDVTVVLAADLDLCEVPTAELTAISEVQGPAAATPISGQQVVTRGVVTADFTSGGDSGKPADQGLRGLFIEAVSADRDDDHQTSEGVFVFDGGGTFDGQIGDLVYVYGRAGEFSGVTQIGVTRLTTCDIAGLDTTLPPPAELPLPVAPEDRATVLEPLESMRVTHPELTVVEFFQVERFGELRLSSGGVLANPTNLVDPHDDAAYEAVVAFNAANNIVLDDGRTGQNLDPLPYVRAGGTLRIGDQLLEATAILHFGFGSWRLQPIDIDELTDEFPQNRTRPRPETPPSVGGSLKVASFNVLNYFDGDPTGVFPTTRGAVTASEFARQTEKIVDAILRFDADIVGLIEIQNDGGETQSTRTLVEAINTELGEEAYAFVDTGVIGTDEIKLAFVYQVGSVTPVGSHAILDSSVDPRFEDDLNRPVLAQTFEELATGEAVTVAVNHLKSKGSACLPADNDPRQGNCNGVRLRAAEAMADWLATNPTGQDAVGTLIIGDLNAYAKEDPIAALQVAGYTDLLDAFAPDGSMPYTYTFDATQGYLDHALADANLLPQVTSTAAWNINADEVPAIDYLESCCGITGNQRFRTTDVAERFYDPSAFRSSDHDPVLIGLSLTGVPVTTDECKDGFWSWYEDITFRNQGQCVSFVASGQLRGNPAAGSLGRR